MRRWHAEWPMMRRRWDRAWAVREAGWHRSGARAWAVPPPPTREEREDMLTRHALRALLDGPPLTGPGIWWTTPCGPGIAGYGRYRKRKPFAGRCGRGCCYCQKYDAKAWRKRWRPRTARRASDE